jgi:hypothetical protein
MVAFRFKRLCTCNHWAYYHDKYGVCEAIGCRCRHFSLNKRSYKVQKDIDPRVHRLGRVTGGRVYDKW